MKLLKFRVYEKSTGKYLYYDSDPVPNMTLGCVLVKSVTDFDFRNYKPVARDKNVSDQYELQVSYKGGAWEVVK